MKQKILIAFSTVAVSIGITISIAAHCGSTWVVAPPAFGPTLGPDGCTVGGNPTITSKSVATTIHWTVGPPLPVVVTDSGENAMSSGNCIRCFPIFNSPEWIDLGNGVTDWRQLTFKKVWGRGADPQGCFIDLLRQPDIAITHHYGRSCTVGEEECESEFNWFWNPINDGCQEEGPAPCFLEPLVCDPGSWNFEWCGCVPYSSPIVIDVADDGFNLTNANGGVVFNLNGTGGKEKLAWTSVSSDDAWLVLDRNGNGTIDDGSELFGDVTPQPDPPGGEKKNGFRALAEYDKTSNGGNADGQIESGDSVFPSLRLWRDANHDGLSDPSELNTLPSKNVAAIELDYKLSKKTDNNGNKFSFRAKVKSFNGQQLGRWAWDVYLVKSQ